MIWNCYRSSTSYRSAKYKKLWEGFETFCRLTNEKTDNCRHDRHLANQHADDPHGQPSKVSLGLELTGFSGHVEAISGGVRDTKIPTGLSAGISPSNGGFGPLGPNAGRALRRVRANRTVNREVGSASGPRCWQACGWHDQCRARGTIQTT